jgi:hypothetical protein
MIQMEVLSQQLLGGIEETYENVGHDSRCSGLYLNRKPPKYKSEMLSLER